MKAFLKWAGGKSKIFPNIKAHFKEGKRLVEPFVGSGSVFLNTSFEKYLLCDNNIDLINVYNNLKKFPDKLIAKTKDLFVKHNNSEEQFYLLREKFNLLKSNDIEKSAIFIYLNKHAFNGLCRYNSKGLFNVPFGRYKNPEFPDSKMYNFAEKSHNAIFKYQDFDITFKQIRQGDIVYCDPPYVPLTDTSNFTAYSKKDFNIEQHKKLAQNAEVLQTKGIQCIVSNHDSEITRELYKKSNIFELKVQRFIASKVISRKRVGEIIAVF